MSQMFCFQCQQTAGGSGCVKVGVCGKQPDTAALQDGLVCSLVRLATAARKAGVFSDETTRLLEDGLFMTLTNVNFDNGALRDYTLRLDAAIQALGAEEGPVVKLWQGETDTVSLRSTLLFGLKGMAAYAHQAAALGFREKEVDRWLYKGLAAIGEEHTVEEWLSLIMEFGKVNLTCMELLDWAHTESYGVPKPAKVPTDIKKGPFIVVSGHDLRDLYMLLRQTEGKGINIYTHGEMLPAHGYPELRKFPHLAGNFGTAWQNQQKEFDGIPAPILMTTNCLMPPRESYRDRLYTTSVVGYEGIRHIPEGEDGVKDFSPLIRAGAPARRLPRGQKHVRHQRRPPDDDRLCPRGAAGAGRGFDRRHEGRQGQAHLPGRRLRRRPPGAELLHRVCQAGAPGLPDPDPRLREIPV